MPDLLFTIEGCIANITLNRPADMNSFSEEMIDLWINALEKIRDSESIRVVIVTGSGKGFCAGGNTKAIAEGKGFYYSKEDITTTALARKNSLWKKVQRIPLLLEEIDQPVIAKMHGFAFGAGLDMALMCDIRIAAKNTKLSESYIKLGLVPGDGATYFLPRLVGTDLALDMLWTSKIVTAAKGEQMGLVTYAVEEDELEIFTKNYVEKLVTGPQETIRIMKRAVYQNREMSLRASLDMISSAMGIVTELRDFEEAKLALKEKREPKFT